MSAEQNVRLSAKEHAILSLLMRAGRRGLYGLQLVQHSSGELRRGTVYVTLERMQQKGFVESRQEEKQPGISGIPRRIYCATWYGIRVFQAWEKLQGLSVFRMSPPTPSTTNGAVAP
jgi:DNA-binding PadR family transcriptional regulator